MLSISPVLSTEPLSPFDVGDRAQLFVDQVLVRSTSGIAFTLHPAKKHPGNPLLRPDKPWEGSRLCLYGSVLHDAEEGLFKMWYYAEGAAVCYATSQDGIHWDKPPVGTVRRSDVTQHNFVEDTAHLPNITKDTADPDSSRRYKMICFGNGYHTKVSTDGLTWKQHSDKPICREGDVIGGYYDRQRKLWVAFPKIEGPWRGHGRRIFYLITSPDFEKWSEPQLILAPDVRDDAGSLARIEEVRPLLDRTDDPAVMRTEFYGLGVYQQESCTLAFPWVFTINANARWGNQEGPSELQLAVSRDLTNWERPFRLPCVPRGKVGEWDSGWWYSAAEAIRVGDEIRLYYGAGNYTHGTPVLYRATYDDGTPTDPGHKITGAIGLATWKLDRFVSADAGAQGGVLTTVPTVYSGDRLELNAVTQKGGSITVETLDLQGKVVGRSKPFVGDDLRHRMDWEKRFAPRNLVGKPVALRFHIRSGELYSFAFRQ